MKKIGLFFILTVFLMACSLMPTVLDLPTTATPFPQNTLLPTSTETPTNTPLPSPTVHVELTPTLPSQTSPTPTTTPTETLQPTPAFVINFERWTALQVVTLLTALDKDLDNVQELATSDLPFAVTSAVTFEIKTFLKTTPAQILTFRTPQELEAAQSYLRNTAQSAWIFTRDNVLLYIDGNLSESNAEEFNEALHGGILGSIIHKSHQDLLPFEDWEVFYPIDRGQQSDPQTGRSQRTYNRWEGDPIWYYGLSIWKYQNPEGGDGPPPYFPDNYQGTPIEYYVNYQCPEKQDEDLGVDCTNWLMYIELLTHGKDSTELANWARGGWGWKTPRPITWEVYYQPSAFDGHCDAKYIRENFTDADLADPSIKAPLIFRLPGVDNVEVFHQPICAVKFKSYLLYAKRVIDAGLWFPSTKVIGRSVDPNDGRIVINPENHYYEYLTTIDGENVYREWAYEVYWVKERQSEEPLRNGLVGFWWFEYAQPMDDNIERDLDHQWSDLQWCYQDLSIGPSWLGTLRCESPENSQ